MSWLVEKNGRWLGEYQPQAFAFLACEFMGDRRAVLAAKIGRWI